MHFDIVEAIRAKQQKQPKSIIIRNGEVVVVPVEPDEEVEPKGLCGRLEPIAPLVSLLRFYAK